LLRSSEPLTQAIAEPGKELHRGSVGSTR
jgi:hypothetical protein